jgi:hypothetical protein
VIKQHIALFPLLFAFFLKPDQLKLNRWEPIRMASNPIPEFSHWALLIKLKQANLEGK